MAIRKKTKTNKKVEKQMEKVFMKDRRLTVSVGTTADFGKAKVQLSLSENVKEDKDPMDLVDAIYELLVDKLEDKFDDLCEKVGVNDEDEENEEAEAEEEDAADVEEENDAEEEDDGDDITEEEILKMKKVALIEVIEDEELDIDPKDYKKIADLREAVIDELFEDDEDEEEEEEEEEDDDEWGDDDDEDSDSWDD